MTRYIWDISMGTKTHNADFEKIKKQPLLNLMQKMKMYVC